jgi:hypothetical protein
LLVSLTVLAFTSNTFLQREPHNNPILNPISLPFPSIDTLATSILPSSCLLFRMLSPGCPSTARVKLVHNKKKCSRPPVSRTACSWCLCLLRVRVVALGWQVRVCTDERLLDVAQGVGRSFLGPSASCLSSVIFFPSACWSLGAACSPAARTCTHLASQATATSPCSPRTTS